jgi:hypothetical protein
LLTGPLDRSEGVLADTAPRLVFCWIQPECFCFHAFGSKTCPIMGLAGRAAVQIEGKYFIICLELRWEQRLLLDEKWFAT